MPKLAATHLTDILIKKLKPGKGSRTEVRDAQVQGLGLRVSTTKKTWFVMARAAGRQERRTLGHYPAMSLAEARQEAPRVLQAIKKGQPTQRQSAQSFSQLFDLWLREDQAQKKACKEVKRAMNRDILPHLKSRAVDTLTTADISNTLAKARNGKPPGPHGNRLLSYTKRMFNWAEGQGYLTSPNPVKTVRKAATETSRDRYLSQAELRQLWKATAKLGYPFEPFFKLLILTGQRRNEVAGMDWSEIDLPSLQWNLPRNRTKNNRPHIVPLSALSASILEGLKHRVEALSNAASGPVLTTKEGRPVSGFSKAKKRLDALAKIADWHVHDLRRTFATLADDELKASHSVIELCLNHVSGTRAGVAGTYNRSEKLAERRQLMAEWAAFAAGSGAEPEEIDQIDRPVAGPVP